MRLFPNATTCVVLSAFALLAASVSADLSASEPPKAEQPKQEEADTTQEPKKICRQIAMQMNSRRKERVCMTKEEWRDFNNQR